MTDERDAGEVAGAIADGVDIDWDAALGAAPGEQRALLEQLRVLSSISRASGFPPGEESVRVTRHWGPFDIVEELDRGSYGRIYRARDTRVDRDVAVKLLPSAGATGAAAIDEARALGKLRHPNVVAVYGADRFDGLPGLWTEFIEGQTLEQQLRERGRFSSREAILVGIDLCGALAAVHAAGLIHRDVNARNVMRERGGRIVLLDFGGVELSRHGESSSVRLTGTPLYMAPELFAGAPASPQTDVYALGVLLFFLVTGQFPVRGETVADLRDQHRAGRRQFAIDLRPDLSPTLVQVIDKALTAGPVDRYASAGEMRRALVRALDIGAPATGAGTATGQLRQALPGWVMAVLLLAAATAGAVATMLVLKQRTSPQANDVVEQPSDEQWSMISSYHDMADASAARGDWAAAAAAYARAGGVFSATYGDASAPSAIEAARAAYARERAGDANLESIERDYAAALYTIGERAGVRQPVRAAIEGARAVNLRRQGKFVDAAHALIRAIDIRDRTFRQPSSKQLPVMGFTLQQLAASLEAQSPAEDSDRDWVPDVIERTVGLDPARVDSDGNGIPDDEEDTDGDGVLNGLEWAVTVDPTSTFGFDGTTDPRLLGARWQGGTTARVGPTAERTWRVSGPLVHTYSYQTSELKKRQAHARGWRLFMRGRARRGDAFAGLDLFPVGPVFVINPLVPDARSLRVRLLRHASTTDTLTYEFPASETDALFELTRHSSEAPVLFRVNGHRKATEYTGLTENQRPPLLTFGSANNMGAAPDGQADFTLVFLEVR